MTEYVDAIDENDSIVGVFEKSSAYEKKLALRVAGVLLISSKETIFLQQRSAQKKYPLRYDYSAAGHVLSGEDYLTAAHRELQEELGVSANLVPAGVVRATDPETGKLRKLHHVFKAVHDGPFSLFQEEVAGVREFTFGELKTAVTETPDMFTPTFRKVFDQIIAAPGFKAGI